MVIISGSAPCLKLKRNPLHLNVIYFTPLDKNLVPILTSSSEDEETTDEKSELKLLGVITTAR